MDLPTEAAPPWLRRLKRHQWVHVEGPDRRLEGCVMRIGTDEIVVRDTRGRMWVVPAEQVRSLAGVTYLHWPMAIMGANLAAWYSIWPGLLRGHAMDEIVWNVLFMSPIAAVIGWCSGMVISKSQRLVPEPGSGAARMQGEDEREIS